MSDYDIEDLDQLVGDSSLKQTSKLSADGLQVVSETFDSHSSKMEYIAKNTDKTLQPVYLKKSKNMEVQRFGAVESKFKSAGGWTLSELDSANSAVTLEETLFGQVRKCETRKGFECVEPFETVKVSYVIGSKASEVDHFEEPLKVIKSTSGSQSLKIEKKE